MTHAVRWQNLRAAHAGGAWRRTAWTSDEITACLLSWAQAHGRPPYSSELGPRHQLPGYGTITLVCGSVEAVWAALGWPYHCYKPEGRAPRRPATQGNRQCLACDGWFMSEDPRFVKVCATCKQSEAWGDESGVWLNGTAVIHGGDDVLEWWEVVL